MFNIGNQNRELKKTIPTENFNPPDKVIPDGKLSNILLHRKIYPPYGRKIDEIRRAGMIPAMRIIVSTRWELGKAYPRIIVTGEIPIQNLEFKYLAGLNVQVVHFNSDGFIDELVNAIRRCNPRQLCLFNLDKVATGQPALKTVQPMHAKGAVYA